MKGMLINGGENVDPDDVINPFLVHPAVAEVAVISVPDGI